MAAGVADDVSQGRSLRALTVTRFAPAAAGRSPANPVGVGVDAGQLWRALPDQMRVTVADQGSWAGT